MAQIDIGDSGTAVEPVQSPVSSDSITQSLFGRNGLFDTSGRTTAKPSEGDKFQARVKKFEGDRGISPTASNYEDMWSKNITAYIAKNPQDAERAGKFFTTITGREVNTPEQRLLSEQDTWYATDPEGQRQLKMIQNTVGDDPGRVVEEQSRRYAAHVGEVADLQAATRAADTAIKANSTAAEVSKGYWENAKTASTRKVDDIAELARTALIQAAGSPTGTATIAGVEVKLQDVVGYLKSERARLKGEVVTSGQNQINNSLGYGNLREPSDDWEVDVFKLYDSITQIAEENFGTPKKIESFLRGENSVDLIRAVNEQGLGWTLEVNRLFPEEIARDLLSQSGIKEAVASLGKVLKAESVGEDASSEDIKNAATVLLQTGTKSTTGEQVEKTTAEGIRLHLKATSGPIQLETFEKSIQKQLSLFSKMSDSARSDTIVNLQEDLKRTRTAIERKAFRSGFNTTFSDDGSVDFTVIDQSGIPGTIGGQKTSKVLGDLMNNHQMKLYNRKIDVYSNDKFGKEILDFDSSITQARVTDVSFTLPEEVAADTDFTDAVTAVSNNVDIREEWLYRAIDFETAGSWSTSIKNPRSSATGLIQFMGDTAKNLGTTTDALSKMTRAQQMQWVEKYLSPFKGRMKNFADVYFAIHWPLAIGRDDSFVMYSTTFNKDAYVANREFDTNGDGTVTRGETIADVLRRSGTGKATTAGPRLTTEEATVPSKTAELQGRGISGFEGPPAPSGGAPITPSPSLDSSKVRTYKEILEEAGMGRKEESLPGDRGLIRASNATIFDKDMMRLLQRFGLDPNEVFQFNSEAELQAAIDSGLVQAGDKVMVGDQVGEAE